MEGWSGADAGAEGPFGGVDEAAEIGGEEGPGLEGGVVGGGLDGGGEGGVELDLGVDGEVADGEGGEEGVEVVVDGCFDVPG